MLTQLAQVITSMMLCGLGIIMTFFGLAMIYSGYWQSALVGAAMLAISVPIWRLWHYVLCESDWEEELRNSNK